MTKHKFQDIWKRQCVAARSIRVQHGVLSALDYLIGEKLLTYADTAVTRPEFARDLPRFVAEVRDIFSDEEIRPYLDHLERMAAIEDEQVPKENDDDPAAPVETVSAGLGAQISVRRDRCGGSDRTGISAAIRSGGVEAVFLGGLQAAAPRWWAAAPSRSSRDAA